MIEKSTNLEELFEDLSNLVNSLEDTADKTNILKRYSNALSNRLKCILRSIKTIEDSQQNLAHSFFEMRSIQMKRIDQPTDIGAYIDLCRSAKIFMIEGTKLIKLGCPNFIAITEE